MKLKYTLAFVCIVLALFSCTKDPEPVKVTGISLDATSLTLTVGDTQTLSATISPNNADNKIVIWSTSDMSVATVDNNGLVKGVAAGMATITAKSDDGGKTVTCNVTVNAKIIPVESVTLDKSSVELSVSESTTLTATVKPDNASDKTVSWSSSDAGIATVTNGVVKGVSAGIATITAKAGDKTATCSVNVSLKNLENPEKGGEWGWEN